MTALPAPDGPDPFPAYARLRRRGPQRDPGTGVWLMARHADVRRALEAPELRIRPADTPGAPWLGDGPAAVLFRNHVRMSDGAAHHARRSRIEAAMACLPAVERLATAAAAETAGRLDRTQVTDGVEAMSALAYPVPLSVVARWIGLPPVEAEEAAALAERFAPALLPWSDGDRIAAAQHAAAGLTGLLEQHARRATLPFFEALMKDGGPDRPLDVGEAVAAVAGLLAQTCDATAGLLGKTLAVLLGDPALADPVRGGGAVTDSLLDEVLRFDPPNHSTRRVAGTAVTIGGAAVQPGDHVVLLLAAAGRDERVYADAGRFVAGRFEDPAVARHMVFGAGPHRCPGAAAARAIVAAAVATILRHPRELAIRDRDVTWRPSGNSRIPARLWLG